jgi:hypothetical protein
MLGRIGQAQVSADVDGAEVVVDGRSHGPTPLRAPIRLTPGPHQVVVQAKTGPALSGAHRGGGAQDGAGQGALRRPRRARCSARGSSAAPPGGTPRRGWWRRARGGSAGAAAGGADRGGRGRGDGGGGWMWSSPPPGPSTPSATNGGCLKQATCEEDARFVARRNTQSLLHPRGSGGGRGARGSALVRQSAPCPRRGGAARRSQVDVLMRTTASPTAALARRVLALTRPRTRFAARWPIDGGGQWGSGGAAPGSAARAGSDARPRDGRA